MADEFFGNKEDVKVPSKIINHLEIYYPDEKTTFPSNNLLIERTLPLIDHNDKVVAFVRTIKDIRKDKQ